MATKLPPLPPLPAQTVQRFDAQGRPTTAQRIYETALQRFLDAVKAAVEGTGG